MLSSAPSVQSVHHEVLRFDDVLDSFVTDFSHIPIPSSAPLKWSMRLPVWTSHHWGRLGLSHRSVPWDSGLTSQPVFSNCPASQLCTRKCWVEVRGD